MEPVTQVARVDAGGGPTAAVKPGAGEPATGRLVLAARAVRDTVTAQEDGQAVAAALPAREVSLWAGESSAGQPQRGVSVDDESGPLVHGDEEGRGGGGGGHAAAVGLALVGAVHAVLLAVTQAGDGHALLDTRQPCLDGQRNKQRRSNKTRMNHTDNYPGSGSAGG